MKEDRTDETCDRCKEPISILISDFEEAMKEGEPILCVGCAEAYMNEQQEPEPKRIFKHKACQRESADFDVLGEGGWELVAVDNGIAYFKREKVVDHE